LAFSVGKETNHYHRQIWQDLHGVFLPEYVDVHHKDDAKEVQK